MDPQTLETFKLIGATLGSLIGALLFTRRQIKNVREEHKTREKAVALENNQKVKETEDRFLKQQKAIDDRQAEVVAQIMVLASDYKNDLAEERKRADRLEAALEASRETAEERARMIAAFEQQTAILREMHTYDLGSVERHKTYVQDVAASLTGQLAEQLAPITKGTSTVSEDMRQLKQAMDERATANGEAFTALQTGLNNLKIEVMALVKATGQEHDKTRRDLLEKIDALTRIVTDMAKAPAAEKNSAGAESSNVSSASEVKPHLPPKPAPKEGI